MASNAVHFRTMHKRRSFMNKQMQVRPAPGYIFGSSFRDICTTVPTRRPLYLHLVEHYCLRIGADPSAVRSRLAHCKINGLSRRCTHALCLALEVLFVAVC
jgi:hypothetical protein